MAGTESRQAVFEMAVRYQVYHALGLFAVAWLAAQGENRLAYWAGVCFLSGSILFSGSLYALSLSGLKVLGMITPFGGLAFLAGWLFMFLAF